MTWRVKIICKSHKGSALVLVLIVMLVLSILSIALLNISLADTKHAVRGEKNIQAHFIARSGANLGLKILEQKLLAETWLDMATVENNMNIYIGTLHTSNPEIFSIKENTVVQGNFTIQYEDIDANTLKIISTGTLPGINPVSQTVSITVKTKFPATDVLNPDEWITGINLDKGITTAASYLTKGVSLEGNPIQSPKGGYSSSIFQASVISFIDYRDCSFRQINNTVDITFDSEIIFYQSKVQLNSSSPPNKIILLVSSDVLSHRPSLEPIQYSTVPVEGFESVNRYSDIIAGLPSVPGFFDYSLIYNTTYSFNAGSSYGIVVFSGNVMDGSHGEWIPKGYYFFESGTDITSGNGSQLITDRKLIEIKSDDILRKAIDGLFKYTVSSQAYIWNRE